VPAPARGRADRGGGLMPGGAGFNAPNILFLNTWDAPERAFVRPLFAALRRNGYTRIVEPCAGAFVMPLVAREAGWLPAEMECSDVSLYTAVCGTLLSRGDFRSLDVRILGEPAEVDYDAEPAAVAAELLWVQLCARMDSKPDVEYWRAIRRDLREQKRGHVSAIADKLRELDRRIGGLTYTPMDLTRHMEAVADDPHTVVNINAPTYKCLGVDERILTADLRWVPSGDLRVGDELFAFDEDAGSGKAAPRRRLCGSTVTHSEPAVEECVRVHLASGESVVCTADHPWLAQKCGPRRDGDGLYLGPRSWVRADQLANPTSRRRNAQPHWYAMRQFPTWEPITSYVAGWLAGMMDGEGSVKVADGISVTVTQNEGRTAGRLEAAFAELGIPVGRYVSLPNRLSRRPIIRFDLLGGTGMVLKALGSLRPERLIENLWGDGIPKMGVRGDPVAVEAVESIGRREIQSISTSSGTYIGEGYLMHNSGFERFFDTKGRLSWNAPDYTIFDPADGVAKMLAQLEGRAALLLTLQQAAPGAASHPMPIYGRHLSPGQVVYYLSNRPDEVFAIMGGPKARPRTLPPTAPLRRPVLPVDYPITEAAEVVLLPIKGAVAAYYKDLWLHRITPKSAGQDMLVLVDGRVAGLFGYDLSPLVRPYNDKWRDAAILTYALGAPHVRRTTRLVTMLALQRVALDAATTTSKSIHPGMARKLVTSEFTRHPEAKGLRGLMKLASRTKDPKAGYKLVYSADLEDHGLEEAVRRWLDREDRWERERAKDAARKNGAAAVTVTDRLLAAAAP
jgi:hypothetical protein